MDKKDYFINCTAMAIVNHTCEIHKISVEERQKYNDELFDFAVNKIKELIKERVNNETHL